MRREIVITDLTRFQNPTIVCTAGIDLASGDCIRPMPYLAADRCRELRLRPGSRLRGSFAPRADRTPPHAEDSGYSDLGVASCVDSGGFRNALVAGLFPTVRDGFEHEFRGDDRCVPLAAPPPPRSLITVSIAPRRLLVVAAKNEERVRLNFRDATGAEIRFVPITDAAFHDLALESHRSGDLAKLNDWLHSQSAVFLRLGLSRNYEATDGRRGYWLQVNGVYTFPHRHPAIPGFA